MTITEALKIVGNRRITQIKRLDAALLALACNLQAYEDEMRRLVARRKDAVIKRETAQRERSDER